MKMEKDGSSHQRSREHDLRDNSLEVHGHCEGGLSALALCRLLLEEKDPTPPS